MRTLICEFQPFHSVQVDIETFPVTFDGQDIIYHRPGRTIHKSGSPGKHYHYAYVGDKPVKKGDWALVHNGSEFGIVEIKRVVPGIDSKVTKHVIEVLTQDEFKSYLERNAKVDELRGMVDELEYRLEQHKKLDKYKDLAKEDPRSAELLAEVQKFFGMPPSEQITTEAK